MASAQDLSYVKHENSKRIQQETTEKLLLTVIHDLEKELHVNFAYQKKHLNGKYVQYKPMNGKSLETYLAEVLNPLKLTFKKVENIYVIQPMEEGVYQIKPQSNLPIPATYSASAFAVTITGNVTSQDDGQALPGVNVLLKGSTTGTTTDPDGNYSLSVPDAEGTLVFSFIGYAPQEVAIGGRTTINVVMAQEAQALNEVVVTALGIEREKKALAYSVSEVKGSEFTQAREVNVANALSGKIAGVNATGMATGPGGSSRIIIRGNGSLAGNNQPLYVINGMPIDNSIPGGGTTTGGEGINVDRGDGIAGINPDDIESISVLKGGPAAALYGSRAANGVILITTKKGRAQKGIGVEYNTTLTLESPSIYPKYQYEYGQGFDGRKPLTRAEALSSGRLSYGARMDGLPSIQFDGVERPYSPVNVKDNIKNFYRTGSTYVNTVALTGGNESINYRFSLSDTDAKSLQPNSKFNRKTANLNLNAFLGKKLSIEAVAQYNLEKAHNRPDVGYADVNAAWSTYLLANTVDIRSLSPGYDENGKEIEWNPVPIANNAYFVTNRFQNDDTKNRFIGQANIRYAILDNLSIRGSVSKDFYNFNYVGVTPTGTAYSPLGGYESIKSEVSETNSMLTLNYNTSIAGSFNFSAMAGGNIQRGLNNETSISGSQFIIPYFYSYTNLSTLTTRPNNRRTGINSVFGSADVDYKGIIFLSFTGRQDWFSTLSAQNNSIFYPSIGGSLVLSEAIQLPSSISFLKLRGSWAQVGGATPDPYIINQTFSMVQGGHNGRPVQAISSTLLNNPDLRPLTSTTSEIGIDLQLLNKRLGLDVTLYNRKTTDDIVQTDISTASGYTRALLNVGELSNKGIEVLLTGSPVRTEKFSWDVSYNMAYNKSEIVQLAEGLNSVGVANGIGGATITNEVGRPYGIIKGYKIKTNANGQVVFNTNSGYEVRSDLMELGLGVPPLTMGLTNNFSYKNFSLSVLLDGKFGNKIYSNLNQYAYRFGLLKETLPGRDNGLTLNGVDEEGNPYERVVPIEQLDTYYDNRKNYTDLFVYDGSFIKLRQVILSYNLPVSYIKFIRIQSASLSLVGRNLAILYSHATNSDPESSYTSGNGQGLEALSIPRTRSYGLNLLVKF
ncbi:SusC/RagA family TonB-linked outer membrane protein [Rhodocytophaga rosea]|uniref:SusC/RagA family TonB-linked outer membrane protein n=2 Tax=Rhodocytophaga rosea TaxID=2704465 RepID=A0A6C0GUN4_9BACT|nr:SusC/RagA family TonB-linked outer membrane protein [Rhodocytophaga rosea]